MPARKILIVDDDETFRLVLSESLSARGYDVHSAANAVEAKARISERPPDIVLLDIMMPDMDGVTLCRELRSAEAMRHVPILIVSALDDSETVKEALLFGATDFMVKPVDLVKAEKKIEDLLKFRKGAS
jgi:DNA-binding response OmpR family regulator